jgi:hypothetical protein
MEGEGTWERGGETEEDWLFGDGSRFIACPMGGTDVSESNVGRSVKKPGGPARMLCGVTIVSIEFMKTGETISDILGPHIEVAVPLTLLAILAKAEGGSMSWVCTEDEELGINPEDID